MGARERWLRSKATRAVNPPSALRGWVRVSTSPGVPTEPLRGPGPWQEGQNWERKLERPGSYELRAHMKMGTGCHRLNTRCHVRPGISGLVGGSGRHGRARLWFLQGRDLLLPSDGEHLSLGRRPSPRPSCGQARPITVVLFMLLRARLWSCDRDQDGWTPISLTGNV